MLYTTFSISQIHLFNKEKSEAVLLIFIIF